MMNELIDRLISEGYVSPREREEVTQRMIRAVDYLLENGFTAQDYQHYYDNKD